MLKFLKYIASFFTIFLSTTVCASDALIECTIIADDRMLLSDRKGLLWSFYGSAFSGFSLGNFEEINF